MNISHFSSVAFTSKIKFVSEEEFKNRTASEERSFENKLYIGDPWDDVAVGPKTLTEDIFGCNAGGLTNTKSKDVVMFHFKPAAITYTADKFQDKISNALSQMGQYTERLGGLIIGGKTASSTDVNYENSKKVSKKLEEFMAGVGATITKFWGQKTPGSHTNLFYSGEEDTWYVNFKDCRSYVPTEAIQTADDIKEAYYDIEVSDNDQVYIGEQVIDKFDLVQGYKKIDGGYELDLKPPGPSYQPQYDYSDGSWRERNKVNLFLADFGQDKSTLWVEPKTVEQMGDIVDRINEIRQASMFENVQKIQYEGESAAEGFIRIGRGSEGKEIFERKL